MKEIGNFFELETTNLSTKWLKGKILVNSGRNALRYIIRLYKIKEIFVPAYTCQFVWLTLKEEGCKINFYHIDKNFMPQEEFNKNSHIIYNNSAILVNCLLNKDKTSEYHYLLNLFLIDLNFSKIDAKN